MRRSSGSNPSNRNARAGLRLRAHPEHERRTEQVLERLALADERVRDELRADDRYRQLRAAHALQRGEQRAGPTGSLSRRQPSSKENSFSRPRSDAQQVHREHRDQPHDLLADALGLRVLRRGCPGWGAGQVADRQVGDLALADRRQPHRGSAKPSWVSPERA